MVKYHLTRGSPAWIIWRSSGHKWRHIETLQLYLGHKKKLPWMIWYDGAQYCTPFRLSLHLWLPLLSTLLYSLFDPQCAWDFLPSFHSSPSQQINSASHYWWLSHGYGYQYLHWQNSLMMGPEVRNSENVAVWL